MEIFSECFKKPHILSRIDGRIKTLVGLIILIMVLNNKGFTFPVLVTLLCFFLCIKMQVPLKVLIARFSGPIFIVLVILLLKFFSQDGLMIAVRIIGAVSIVVVMGFAMPFREFITALLWLKVPRGFIEILMFAYRYIFLFLEEAMVIYNAQKNRLGYSSIRLGLESFGILTGSLILKAFNHSHNITVSMVQRGYDGSIPMLKHKPFKTSEIVLASFFLIIMGVVWSI